MADASFTVTLSEEDIQRLAEEVARKIVVQLPYAPYRVGTGHYYPPYHTWWTVNSAGPGNQA